MALELKNLSANRIPGTARDGRVADEDAYLRWLVEQYGDVARRFPPASVVCFEDDEVHEFLVIEYFEGDDGPSIGIMDIALASTVRPEELEKRSRRLCPKHELPRLKYLWNHDEDMVRRARALCLTSGVTYNPDGGGNGIEMRPA